VAGGLGVLVVLSAVPTVWKLAVAGAGLDAPASVPAEPVALVFGAKVNGHTPTPFLANRLNLAIDLYRRHKVRQVLLSGARTGPDHDEPDAMRDYLLARGVAASDIGTDYAGFDTLATRVRARQVFHVERAIVLTQTFHLARATALCRANGIDAYGIGDDSGSTDVPHTLWGCFRLVNQRLC
jgi:vancomycin permeability regulator SanA